MGAESVTSDDVPVAVDPSQLNRPVHPSETTDSDELLKHKLSLANNHARQAKREKDELSRQLSELQAQLLTLQEAQQSAVRENLEGQGAFKELYEQERSRAKELETRLLNETASLKTELESVTQNAAQDRLKATALNQLSRANALHPAQLYTLLQPSLRTDDEGNPAVLSSGVEQPLGDYLANLKQSTEWQHHFGASQAKGMGTGPAATSVAPGMSNPYRTRNLTEALKLEVENPELAKHLKAEAMRG